MGFPIEPATRFDPKIEAPTDARGAGAGTAFPIDSRGVWLSGAPTLDVQGRVPAVTVAQVTRGRRGYITTPLALAAFLLGFWKPIVNDEPAGVEEDGYHSSAYRLRRMLSVAQVARLDSRG